MISLHVSRRPSSPARAAAGRRGRTRRHASASAGKDYWVARSPLGHPPLKRHHVGPLAVAMRPAVDCPFLPGVDVAQDGGGVGSDEEAARFRPLDLVVLQQMKLVED